MSDRDVLVRDAGGGLWVIAESHEPVEESVTLTYPGTSVRLTSNGGGFELLVEPRMTKPVVKIVFTPQQAEDLASFINRQIAAHDGS